VKLDDLFLWYLERPEAPRYVGSLHRVLDGKGVSLRYGTAWLRDGFPLSEDLPLVDVEHLPRGRLAAGEAVAVGAVDDARPDRWGQRVIDFVERPRRRSLMEYLYYAGDDRHGALGVSTSESAYLPKPGGPLPRLEQIETVAEAVRKVLNRQQVDELESKVLSAGGSFGGAKPKALIEIEGEQWLVKFSNGEPVDTALIEHATMTLAREAGITTADTMPLKLVGEHALAVRRFDRLGGSRVHSVSAGTALRAATTPEQLSLGYPALAQLLRRAGVSAGNTVSNSAVELFRRMVFNILMDNTDDHEKNHALLDHGPGHRGRYSLSPAYDMLPANSGQGMQEFICGAAGRESSLSNAMSQCVLFGLDAEGAADQVAAVIRVVGRWKDHFRACNVTDDDIDNLAQSIDNSDIGRQRMTFDPGTAAKAFGTTRKSRSGAFRRQM
jgi:serine/threonine-protein kinase HipA